MSQTVCTAVTRSLPTSTAWWYGTDRYEADGASRFHVLVARFHGELQTATPRFRSMVLARH